VARYMLVNFTSDQDAFSEEDIELFSLACANRPARAGSALYRNFIQPEAFRILGGSYTGTRLSTPTRVLVGADDPNIRPEFLHGSRTTSTIWKWSSSTGPQTSSPTRGRISWLNMRSSSSHSADYDPTVRTVVATSTDRPAQPARTGHANAALTAAGFDELLRTRLWPLFGSATVTSPLPQRGGCWDSFATPLWRESDDGRRVTAYPEGTVARDGESMWMPE
jgi:hypothetical protein